MENTLLNMKMPEGLIKITFVLNTSVFVNFVFRRDILLFIQIMRPYKGSLRSPNGQIRVLA